ncbi:MAG: hypothetical protein M0Q49_01790 [Porticoccaceae bacterium]|nr:hypothetical protein [Porticoccaceae bacterium]
MSTTRERPIIFGGEMVRAILGGQKTQTRRAVKPQPSMERDCEPEGYNWVPMHKGRELSHHQCPYGQPGDRLWVRERWRVGAWDADEGAFALDYCDGPRRQWLKDPLDHDGTRFERLWIQCTDELREKGIPPGADGHYRWGPGKSPLRWRPSIHMPRWASRILLEILSVRVERLQDISGMDAKREGVSVPAHLPHDGADLDYARREYHSLWQSINGPGSWDANPWVWVIEFKRAENKA